MSGIGEATICTFTQGVCNAIIKNMWKEYVHDLFPKTVSQFSDAIAEINWLTGGRYSNKEYHNFKNIYSIILMSMTDA